MQSCGVPRIVSPSLHFGGDAWKSSVCDPLRASYARNNFTAFIAAECGAIRSSERSSHRDAKDCLLVISLVPALRRLVLEAVCLHRIGFSKRVSLLKSNNPSITMKRRWFQNRKKKHRIERTCRHLKSNDKELTEIDWDDKEVTDADLIKVAKALSSNTELKELHLCENDISKIGASELMFALRTNVGVRELWLSVNNICDGGAASMSGLLRYNTTLRWLNLNENNITSEGASYIASGLQRNKTLEYLWLNGNRICDSGAKSLAGALGVNETLQLFSLAENRISEAGADALAAALRINVALRVLGLYGNFVGDAGAAIIASSLSDNASLTELYLGKNGITSRGAVAFAKALQSGNSTVLKLWLAQNRVDDEGATALAFALTVNTTLQEINLGQNDITKRGARALAEALRTNTVLATTGLKSDNASEENEEEDAEGDENDFSYEESRGQLSKNTGASGSLAQWSYNSSASYELSYESSASHDPGKATPYDDNRISPPELDGGVIVEADSEHAGENVKMGTDARWQHRSSSGDCHERNGTEDEISDREERHEKVGSNEETLEMSTSSFALTSALVREGRADEAVAWERKDPPDEEVRWANGNDEEEAPYHGVRWRGAAKDEYARAAAPEASQQHQQWDRAKENESTEALEGRMACVSVGALEGTRDTQETFTEATEKMALEGT